MTQAAKDLLSDMIDEDSEILTILYGEDATEEDVESLLRFVMRISKTLKSKSIMGNNLYILSFFQLNK